MIIVAGEFQIAEGDIDAAKAAMTEMAAETAKEDGCIHYRFYQDVEYTDWLHVYEEWETQKHLDAHAASAHMQVFRGKMGALGITERYVRKIEAEDGGTLI